MKTKLWIAALAISALVPLASKAQAPAGATGQCKDGTYSTAASKSGACSGHKGVQTWYSATGKAPAKPVAMTPAPASAPAPAPAPAPTAMRATKPAMTPSGPPAAGGGAGMVWVNLSSKVYHCPGDKYYGKTKEGKYMTESAAKSMGAHPDHKKACGL